MLKKTKTRQIINDTAELEKCWDSADKTAEIDDAECSPGEPFLHYASL